MIGYILLLLVSFQGAVAFNNLSTSDRFQKNIVPGEGRYILGYDKVDGNTVTSYSEESLQVKEEDIKIINISESTVTISGESHYDEHGGITVQKEMTANLNGYSNIYFGQSWTRFRFKDHPEGDTKWRFEQGYGGGPNCLPAELMEFFRKNREEIIKARVAYLIQQVSKSESDSDSDSL